VHHFHHFDDAATPMKVEATSSTVEASPTTTTATTASVTSPSEVTLTKFSGQVRLCVDSTVICADGTIGAYLGVTETGELICNASASSTGTVFSIIERGMSKDDSGLFHVSLRSTVTSKCLRITGSGSVDANGGNGRWTLFSVSEQNGAVQLKSVANTGKANNAKSSDWYLGVIDGKVSGTSGPFTFRTEIVSPTVPIDETKGYDGNGRHGHHHGHHHHHHHGHRNGFHHHGFNRGDRPDMDDAERQRRREIREKERSEWRELKEKRREEILAARAQKKEIAGGWTVVLKKAEPASTTVASSTPAPVSVVAPSTAPISNFRREADLEIKVTSDTKTSSLFPVNCIVHLTPAAFADSQNRKGTIGWNIGCSPNGFLVPDASTGSWGQWKSIPGPKGSVILESVILESVHTSSFHLAIRKDRQLSHKGGRGRFAQFEPVRHGKKFYALKCVGFDEPDAPAYLAVSPSGVPYAASAISKETCFIVRVASESTTE